MLPFVFVLLNIVITIASSNNCNPSTNQTCSSDDNELANQILREEMIDLFKIAAIFNWDEGIDGHMSASIGNNLMFINRFGTNWGSIIDSDIITVNVNTLKILSSPIDRDRNTPGKGLIGWRAAIWMNAIFHREFTNMKVIFHCHCQYIRSFAISGDKLKMIDQNSLRFKNRIIYYNYSGIVVNEEKAMNLVNIYRNNNDQTFSKDIIIMRNHGVLILANSVSSAFNTIYFLEIAVKTQMDATSHANAAGTQLITIDNEVQDKTVKKFQGWAQDVFAKNNFEAFRRRYTKS